MRRLCTRFRPAFEELGDGLDGFFGRTVSFLFIPDSVVVSMDFGRSEKTIGGVCIEDMNLYVFLGFGSGSVFTIS